jgi:pSer/pThr/pTyr-binding forkhead associated (FHA) protein
MPRIVLQELDSDKAHTSRNADAVIGRDPACGFPIEGPKSTVVSGHHARIFFQDHAWWIQDVSRNGTVLDDERLLKGERHALRVGQVIGLGDSGPRFRVTMLESRVIAETIAESPSENAPAAPRTSATPRRQPVSDSSPDVRSPVPTDTPTAALRSSEAARGGLRIEEPTEPMGPAPYWVAHVVLKLTHTDKRYDVRGETVKLGRSSECLVQVPKELGASVSRFHAEIAIQEGGVVVRDVGSRNGTFVNGSKIYEPQPARRGDKIMLGPGGPTFVVEDLRIVKGEQPSMPPSASAASGPGTDTPPYNAALLAEPPTDPPAGKLSRLYRAITPARRIARSSLGEPRRNAFFRDAVRDVSHEKARRIRFVVWVGVVATVAIALLLLWMSQSRVAANDIRLTGEPSASAAPRDSIRRSR